MTNLVKEPTCFAQGCNPSLVDVILTNKPNFCANICNFDCGVSDIHNLVAVQFKAEIPPRGKNKKTYRSYKNFNYENFIEDLENAHLENIDDDIDVNKAYDEFNKKFIDIYNKHVPVKQRKLVRNPAPFMNSKLKKAVYKKRMLHNKYQQHKNSETW